MATEVGVLYLSVLPSARGFGKELNAMVAKTNSDAQGRKIGKGMLGGIGSVLKSGAKLAGVGSAASMVLAPLVKGFGRLKALEDARASLTGLGHDAKSVAKIMTNATAAVKGTAFGLDEAASVAAGVVAAGIKPGQDLQKTLRLVADAATIAKTDMGSMGAIFNKVAATNKIQGEVLAQLGERGIPILQFLSKELKVSTSEVANLASKGKIDFATFRSAMEHGLGGAALASGSTMAGSFKNMMAAIGRVGANLLGGVYPYFQKFFAGVTGYLGPLEDAAKDVGEAIGRYLAEAIESITPPAKAMASWIGEHREGLKDLAKWLGIAAASVQGLKLAYSATTSVMGGFSAAMKAVKGVKQAYALSTYMSVSAVGAQSKAEKIAAVTGRSLTSIRDAATQAMTTYRASITGATPAIEAQTAAQKVGAKVGKIFASVQGLINKALKANIFVKIAGIVLALGGALVLAYKKSETFRNIVDSAFRAVGDAASWLWTNAIQPAWTAIRKAFDVVASAATWLWTNAIKPAFTAIGDAATWLWNNAIKPAWDAIVAAFGWLREAAQPVVDWLVATLGPELSIIFDEVGKTASFWGDLWASVWDGIKSVVTTVWSFLAGVFDGLKVVLEALGPVVVWLWQNVFVPAWNGIKQAAAGFADWFMQSVWPNLKIILDGLGAAISWLWHNVFVPAWNGIKWAAAGFVDWFVQSAWPIIKQVFAFIGETVKFLYESVWKPIFMGIWEIVKIAFTLIGDIISSAMQFIRGIIQTVMSLLRGDWSGALEGLKAIAGAVWNLIKGIFSAAINIVRNILSTAWGVITGLFSRPMDAAKNAIFAAWDWIKQKFADTTKGVKDTVSRVWANLKSIMQAPVDAGKRAIDTVLGGIKGAFEATKAALGKIWDGIKAVFGRPINAVVGFINSGIIGGYNWVAGKFNLTKLSEIPQVKGFDRGGWTGRGSRFDPAGIVHADEFVVKKSSRRRFEQRYPGLLDFVNRTGEMPTGGVPGYAGGGRVTYRGGTFTAIFAAALKAAEKLAGHGLNITQGGFRPRTSYSGTSHAGDAVDIAQPFSVGTIAALRKSGVAAWDRTGKGNWISHIHGVPLPGFGSPAGSAVWQAQDYLRGGDGLGGRDNGPRGSKIMNAVKGLGEALKAGFDSVASWFKGIVDKVAGPFKTFSAAAKGGGVMEGLVSGVARRLKSELETWVKSKLGLAGGARRAPKGATWVGENGPELVYLRGMESVLPMNPRDVVSPRIRAASLGKNADSASLSVMADAMEAALLRVRMITDLDNGASWFDKQAHRRDTVTSSRLTMAGARL